MNISSKRLLTCLLTGSILLFGSAGSSWAGNTNTITIAKTSWPGLDVKTEITVKLLHTLGYKTKITKLNLPFIYRGLAQGNGDVFMGAWLPAQNKMLNPPVKKNKIVKLGTNLTGAKEGLAVPTYVWKSGIHSVKELAAHANRFQHKIYGIASGSAMNQAFKKAIKDNYEGLGGWKVVASSTAVMLAQVKRSINKKQPIVFFGWKPHWMNVTFNIRYLKDKKGSNIADINSRVLTIASTNFPKKHPNVAQLFRQIKVKSTTQSQWIYQYSHQKQKISNVATNWLKNHNKIVLKWLDGIKTAYGKSAATAYRQSSKFQ